MIQECTGEMGKENKVNRKISKPTKPPGFPSSLFLSLLVEVRVQCGVLHKCVRDKYRRKVRQILTDTALRNDNVTQESTKPITLR